MACRSSGLQRQCFIILHDTSRLFGGGITEILDFWSIDLLVLCYAAKDLSALEMCVDFVPALCFVHMR